MFVLFWATILIYFGVIYHNNIETVKKNGGHSPCALRAAGVYSGLAWRRDECQSAADPDTRSVSVIRTCSSFPVPGSWDGSLAVVRWLLFVGCWLLAVVVGGWLWVVGCWLLVGCWSLLVVVIVYICFYLFLCFLVTSSSLVQQFVHSKIVRRAKFCNNNILICSSARHAGFLPVSDSLRIHRLLCLRLAGVAAFSLASPFHT